MSSVRDALLESEPVLPVDNIQGDVLLGFNKPHSKQVLLDVSESHVDSVKEWLRNVVYPNLTTASDVLAHRERFRVEGYSKYEGPAFVNIAFGYRCIQKLLTGTEHENTLSKFKRTSAFVIGANVRAPLLGDDPRKWKFGSEGNNDISISIAADTKAQLDLMYSKLLDNIKGIEIAHAIDGFRGDRANDIFYGHEHFGFQDGLSQPEVRGTYCKDDETKEKNFVVRRTIDLDDERFANYTKPGFRLIDTEHFLLGYSNTSVTSKAQGFRRSRNNQMSRRMTIDAFNASNDKSNLQSNPDLSNGAAGAEKPAEVVSRGPTTSSRAANAHIGTRSVRKLVNCPDWCANATYQVYRMIPQKVSAFWQLFYAKAVELNKSNNYELDEEGLRNLAGDLAAKTVGRWWDGTPLVFGQPLSGLHYPPRACAKELMKRKERSKFQGKEGLKNGFQFSSEEAKWPVVRETPTGTKTMRVSPPGAASYSGDALGATCPLGAHIRKVNPRDDSTDIGGEAETLKHRLIRRGNNFGSRVNDVFGADDEKERGLLFVAYAANIERQFEFLQRHWANSPTRPKYGGNDLVIGAGAKNVLPFSLQSPIGGDLNVEISTDKRFTSAVGMGYFLLPTKSGIIDVLCAPRGVAPRSINVLSRTSTQSFMYLPPVGKLDFKETDTFAEWDYQMRLMFWDAIWRPSRNRFERPRGVAYRLPEVEELASKGYDDFSVKTYLQFRPTDQLLKMARLAGLDAPVRKVIAWQGFPKRLTDDNKEQNYIEVEKLGFPPEPKARQMDEYCEWFTHRNADGKITRIDITSEAPEYWRFLHFTEPETVLELYRRYVSKDVQAIDLVDSSGDYDMYNEWNTTKGAMHLNCPPNSLSAEIILGAEAAAYWGDCRTCPPHTDGGKLIDCGAYGGSSRASDPTIGADVNSLVRAGLVVSIEDPVGLFLEDLNTDGWQSSNGALFTTEEIDEIVTYERSNSRSDSGIKKNLRIRIEIPADWGYTLGDCLIGGVPIDHAGLVIESSVTVFLVGIAVPGDNFVRADAAQKAVIPCQDTWSSMPRSEPPVPRTVPLYPEPSPPTEDFLEDASSVHVISAESTALGGGFPM